MINKIKSSLRIYKSHPLSALLRISVIIAQLITAAIFLLLIGYILIKGIPYLKPELFSLKYTSDNVSMLPAIINTVSMVIITLIISVPVGIFSSVYMEEYARSGNKVVKLIALTTQTLAGIPSIVYGLFGYLIFVINLKLNYSILSGALTLAIMVLPTIMSTSSEAIKAVPQAYREGSFGLGAGRLRTTFRVVLPSAMPGILSGIILSIGRIVGESAALLYTSGTVTGIAGLTQSGRTLSVHMYALLSEGLHTNEAFATSVVLLLLVIILNAISGLLTSRLGEKGIK